MCELLNLGEPSNCSEDALRQAGRILATAPPRTLLRCPGLAVRWTARVLANATDDFAWQRVWENIVLRPDNLVWSWEWMACSPEADPAAALACCEGVGCLLEPKIVENARVVVGRDAVALLEWMVLSVQATAAQRGGSGNAAVFAEQATAAYAQGVLAATDAGVRRAAVEALSQSRPAAQGAVDQLIKVLADADAGVRSAAAEALGRIGPGAQSAVAPLVKVLADPDECVRRATVDALFRIGRADPAAVESLVGALARIDATVEALSRIGPVAQAAVSPLVEALRQIGVAAQAAVESLVKALGYQSAAREVLGWIDPTAPVAVPPLVMKAVDPVAQAAVEALSHESPSVRKAAVEALGRIGQATQAAVALVEVAPLVEALVKALVQALADPYWGVRWYAAEALGWIGPAAKAAVDPLIKALADTHSSVREAAAEALGRIGPAARVAVASLVKMLADPSQSVRIAPAEALGRLGAAAAEAIVPLRQILAVPDSDLVLRNLAAKALGQIDLAIRGAEPGQKQ